MFDTLGGGLGLVVVDTLGGGLDLVVSRSPDVADGGVRTYEVRS